MAHRVVILGGGFGGLYAAQALKHADIELTMVDRRNFHLFQPLLYQVATGSLSPGEIAAPLRSVLSTQANSKVLLDDAIGLDAANKKLILADVGPLPYDTLIVATGSRTSYFGNDHWEEFAPGLKTVEDATRMRHKVLFAFEEAERESDMDKRNAWLTFIVVGGGPTGVELSGALGEMANDTMRNEFDNIRPEDARILLLDGGERILSNYPESLSDAAVRSLIKLGVRTRNKVRVTGVDADGVTLRTAAGEERIHAKTILWGAGVRASEFGKILGESAGAPLDKGGRVLVSPDLTVAGHPEIFVVGDLAAMTQDGQPLPGVAPTAMQMGKYAAKVIESRLKGAAPPAPFRYFDKGSLAVIGRTAAVAYFEKFGKFKFSGPIAWLLWLFVHLMYIVEFEARVLVFIRWGFNYLTFQRGARLITGMAGKTRKPEPMGS
ncbi:MAG: NAD(P)/FAD-dependent oxidoreductase [Bryobacteraceae bacterium]|nr:NAD(P)/FAD-dependent oxidoreductase [Bryobacteraceae bacterium]